MNLVKFSDFLRLSNFFFYNIGIKPYDGLDDWSYKRALLNRVIFYSVFTNMNFFLFGENLYVVDAFNQKEHFLEASLTVAYIGFLLMAIIKILFVRGKKQKLTDLMLELFRAFPKTFREQEAYLAKDYLRQLNMVTVSFTILYMALAWTYLLFPIFEWLFYEVLLEIRIIGKNLPFFLYIPWHYKGHWSFYLLYASSISVCYSAAAAQISNDLLLCSVATQVIMHYEYVSRNIEEYHLEANKETTNPSERQRQHDNDLKFLSGIASYHSKVLRLSDLTNDVFGIPLLINFMIACVSLCFLAFQMTAADPPAEVQFKLFLFLLAVLAQVFLICYYGQLLIDVSTNVAFAVYHHDWSNADVRYKKMLVLIIQRAQQPSYLQATGFVSISSNTMTIIMQISYKFFALLRTMYAD